MEQKELKINGFYELVKSNELMTINRQGELVFFKKGKVCKIHSISGTIEAYWLDDIWKPIMISKKEFLELFKPSNVC